MDPQENNVNEDLAAADEDNGEVEQNNEAMDGLLEGIDEDEEDWREYEPEPEPAESNEENFIEDEAQEQYEIVRSSRHEYLGDTEEVSGQTVVEENDYITLPIAIPNNKHDLVLLPSQTLPLTIFCPMQKAMLRIAIAKDKIIANIPVRPYRTSRFDKYGTTAEIYEYHMDDRGPTWSIKAKGRQRFKVMDIHRETTGRFLARVKILPEIRVGDPLAGVRLSWQLKQSSPVSSTEAGQTLQRRDVKSIRSASWWRARRHAALLTPWPSWVYDLYDEEQLAVRVVNEIVKQFNMTQDKLQIPRDPQELSNWAAINLPLTDAQKLSFLALNTASQRLRYILCITSDTGNGLFCKFCGRLIANNSNIFCMSTDGPHGTFANPDGVVHEMITVTALASHVLLQGRAHTRHSWFPGYAWTQAKCSTCRSHIGWLFTAKMNWLLNWLFTAKKNLKPRSFYGITRLSVQTKLNYDDDPPHCVI